MRVYTVRLEVLLSGAPDTADFSERVFARLASAGTHPDLVGPGSDRDYTFWLTVGADTPEDAAARAGWTLRTATAEESVSSGEDADIEIVSLEADQAEPADLGPELASA